MQFLDLGTAPPSNAYLRRDDLAKPELWFPLRVMTCNSCWLTQTEDYADRDALFSDDYAYFSSVSSSWLEHSKTYVGEVVERFGLNKDSNVVELAANDGYLLQYIKQMDIPCIGIEPTASTAHECRKKGIDVIEDFFGVALATELVARSANADLIIANNVLAHVPDINDFVAAISLLLKPTGVATFEFPHLLNLVRERQFDTIYHEHFSYLSLTSVRNVFEKHGLRIFDVKQLPTHGGSLRVFADRSAFAHHRVHSSVADLHTIESAAGMTSQAFYLGFQEEAHRIKCELLQFFLGAHAKGQSIVAYGAAAKGNTLLNYAGIRSDLLPWVADRNPAKQGKYLPGSRIAVVPESHIRDEKPEYVWILPWNLRDEITAQLAYIREWGGKFVFAIPRLEVV